MKHSTTRVDINELRAVIAGPAADLPRPLVVTVEGEDRAVVLGREAFRRLMHDHEVLRRLALGDLEFTAGEGHPLDEVLEDCDLLLDES